MAVGGSCSGRCVCCFLLDCQLRWIVNSVGLSVPLDCQFRRPNSSASTDCRSPEPDLLPGSAFLLLFLQCRHGFADLPARGHTSDLHFSLLPCEACIVKQSSCGSRGIKSHIRSAILPFSLISLAFQQIFRHPITIRICFTA